MPTKTVESYEKRMNDEMMKTLRLSPEYLAELGVTLEKLQSFDSISDLTTLDAISIPLMDSLIIRGVSALMQDYIFHHDDNIQTVHGRMFRCGEHSGQKDKARIILIACDIAESEQNHGISRIKDGLESGLFAENLHPLDEFPKRYQRDC